MRILISVVENRERILNKNDVNYFKIPISKFQDEKIQDPKLFVDKF